MNKRIYDLNPKLASDINANWEVEIDIVGQVESSKIKLSEVLTLTPIDKSRINDTSDTTYIDTDEVPDTIVVKSNTTNDTDPIVSFLNGLSDTKVMINHLGDIITGGKLSLGTSDYINIYRGEVGSYKPMIFTTKSNGGFQFVSDDIDRMTISRDGVVTIDKGQDVLENGNSKTAQLNIRTTFTDGEAIHLYRTPSVIGDRVEITFGHFIDWVSGAGTPSKSAQISSLRIDNTYRTSLVFATSGSVKNSIEDFVWFTHDKNVCIGSSNSDGDLTITGKSTDTGSKLFDIKNSLSNDLVNVDDRGRLFLKNGIIEGTGGGVDSYPSNNTGSNNSIVMASEKVEVSGTNCTAISCGRNYGNTGKGSNLGGNANVLISAFGVNTVGGTRNIVIGSGRNVNTANTVLNGIQQIYLGLNDNYLYDYKYQITVGGNRKLSSDMQVNSVLSQFSNHLVDFTDGSNIVTGTDFLADFKIGQGVRIASTIYNIVELTDTDMTLDHSLTFTRDDYPLYVDNDYVFVVSQGNKESFSVDKVGDTNIGQQLVLGSYTTTDRDLITPKQGSIIFNTTTNKHQGYDGIAWNDLY